MAAKRFYDELGDHDQVDRPNPKRTKTKPSLASAIREVIMANFFENFCSALEPMLRRVVSEEVENRVRLTRMRSISKSPSLKLQAAPEHEQPTTLQLMFNKRLSLPIFTGTKIVDIDNNPLEILLFEVTAGAAKIRTSLPYWIKVEIVVLDGDFDRPEFTWSREEFNSKIVKERTGKRPLLAGGEVNITMREGVGSVGEIEFTDNSSWIRSRKFRLGARVVGQGNRQNSVRICEAMTEPFVVKDHRGELYKKHHPPALEDEVWRLEKIGKDGAFHQKLASHNIKTVQDFLKLNAIDPTKLRRIMGMSDKMWEATLGHAKTCILGTKLYRFHGPNYTLTLNPICQIVNVKIEGRVYLARELKSMQTAYIQNLIKDAYMRWNTLEEVHDTPLLTQGEMVVDQYPNEQQVVVRPYMDSQSLLTDGSSSGGGDGGAYADWDVNSGFYLSGTAEKEMRFFLE